MVDWRRSPKNPYPAAIDDVYAALGWAFENAAWLGIDPARVAVGGASSGAGMAAGLALLARDRGDFTPCFQWPIHPMLNDRERTASSRAVTDPRVWNGDKNRFAWAAYLGALARGDVPPYAAPALVADLSGLPPAFIAVGDLDLFVNECIGYAARQLQAAVATELHVYPGAIHGFDLFAPDASVSRRLAADRDGALARAPAR